MPTKIKISKEMILETAFEIVRKNGIEKLSNRELANKLNCSIRPIYYQFENSEELQKELYRKIEKYFYKLYDKYLEFLKSLHLLKLDLHRGSVGRPVYKYLCLDKHSDVLKAYIQ